MVAASGQHSKEEYMKKYLTSAVTVAILTVAIVPTSHAWFVKAKNEMNRLSAGRNAVSGGNSAGRDRVDNRNSFNRMNSPDISGGAKNVNTGNLDSRAEQKGEFKDLGNGTAKNARAGLSEWSNANGYIGQSQSTGGIALGDIGSTYTGTDALNSMNEAARIQASKDIEMKRIETSQRKSGSVR